MSDGARLPSSGLDSRANPLPLRVPWSPLQSPGVHRGRGDILGTDAWFESPSLPESGQRSARPCLTSRYGPHRQDRDATHPPRPSARPTGGDPEDREPETPSQATRHGFPSSRRRWSLPSPTLLGVRWARFCPPVGDVCSEMASAEHFSGLTLHWGGSPPRIPEIVASNDARSRTLRVRASPKRDPESSSSR